MRTQALQFSLKYSFQRKRETLQGHLSQSCSVSRVPTRFHQKKKGRSTLDRRNPLQKETEILNTKLLRGEKYVSRYSLSLNSILRCRLFINYFTIFNNTNEKANNGNKMFFVFSLMEYSFFLYFVSLVVKF